MFKKYVSGFALRESFYFVLDFKNSIYKTEIWDLNKLQK